MPRRLAVLALALLALAMVAAPAGAAAPANDAFGAATPLTADAASVKGDNLGATSETSEPGQADQTWDDCTSFAQRPDCGNSVWYDFAAPATTSYTVETCDKGTEVDTVLGAYTGSGLPGLTSVAHNDDSCDGGYGGNGSRIAFAATAGTTYHVQVSGYGGQQGTFWLRAYPTASPPPVTAIDTRITRYQGAQSPDQSDAGTHSGGRHTATFAFVATNPAATFSCSLDGAPFAACTSPAAYDDISATDGAHHAFSVRATAGPDTDATPSEQRFTIDNAPPDTTFLSPADGTTGGNPFAFTLSSSERTPFFPARCTVDGIGPFSCAGTSPAFNGFCNGAHVVRAAALDDTGNVDPTPAERSFSITGSAACTAPQLGATTAGGLAPTQAQVQAPITTGGEPVTATVRYGTSPAYGEVTSARLDPNTSGTISLTPQGLVPATTYHYELRLESPAGGPVSSGDKTFTTPDLGVGEHLPDVSVGAPQVVGQHAARIPVSTDVGAPAAATGATVYLDDHGPITLASPYVYPDDSLPQTTVGKAALPVDLVDLRPGTTYHYRVLVAAQQSVLTEERTFTTVAAPAAPVPTTTPATTTPAPAAPAGAIKKKHFKISKSRVKVSAVKRSAKGIKVIVSGLPKGTKVALGVKGSKPLGAGRATAPASGKVTLRVKLGAKARKALKSPRLKRLTFTLKATPPGDTASSVTLKVRLRS